LSLDIVLKTTIPIFFLIGLGFLSRKSDVLLQGDERVLSAYVFYFALPALFIVNIAEKRFNFQIITYMFASIAPLLLVLSIFLIFYFIIRFSTNILYLLILSTIFGSLSFFGIPFVMFAFPSNGEFLGTLSSVAISPISVALSITILELYKLEEPNMLEGLKTVFSKLSKNPLIISILVGFFLSITEIEIPSLLLTPLQMLGRTTSTVAIFMLGVFLHGKKYTSLRTALKLSLLRILFLPTVALITSTFFDLTYFEQATLTLMHGMPVAVSMLILSERYNFYKDIFATLILVTSIGAVIYLNFWLIILQSIIL
jgi:hypothetical protein